MSDTPRTDLLLSQIRQGKAKAGCMPKTHGQQLECELTAMTAAKNKAVEALKNEHESVNDSLADEGFEHGPSRCPICKLIKELEEVK